jgi:hypothetical protein
VTNVVAFGMTGISAPPQVSRSAYRAVAEPHRAECWRWFRNDGIGITCQRVAGKLLLADGDLCYQYYSAVSGGVVNGVSISAICEDTARSKDKS